MWPGNGRAKLGYGTVGGIVYDGKGREILARQNILPRLYSQGTKRVSEPVCPAYDGHSTNEKKVLANYVTDLNAGFVSEELIGGLSYESLNLTSPAAIDPLLGNRVQRAATGGTIVYADDFYIREVNQENEIVKTLDLGSPVMSICGKGRLATTHNMTVLLKEDYTGASVVSRGQTADASLSQDLKSAAVLNADSGALRLYDLASGEATWEESMPRGTKSGWGRVGFSTDSPHTLLWSNRYEIAIVDTRTRARTSVLHFPDRQTEIYGVAPSVASSPDVWALTSYHFMWIDMRARQIVLSQDHRMSPNDHSVSVNVASYAGGDLVTATSGISPLSRFWTFGREPTYKLPVSMCDPYFVESWPTIVTQSHLVVDHDDKVDLWLVAREGGLYRQTLVDQETDDQTLPEPDPSPVADYLLPQRDWDTSTPTNKAWVASFENMYKYIYELQRPPITSYIEMAPEEEHEDALASLGFKSLDDVRQYCMEMWVQPLIERGARQSHIDRRTAEVENIVRGLGAIRAPKLSMELPRATKWTKQTKELLAKWPEPESTELFVPESVPEPGPSTKRKPARRTRKAAPKSSQPTQSDTQPTQPDTQSTQADSATQPDTLDMPMTQPVADFQDSLPEESASAMAFSQPLPAVRTTTKKKKPKAKRRRTDGFT